MAGDGQGKGAGKSVCRCRRGVVPSAGAAGESLDRGDVELEVEEGKGGLKVAGDFARGQAVVEGGGDEGNEGGMLGLEHRAVGGREHQRVGSVGDDEGDAAGGAGFHHEAKGGDVGVGAAGEGLEVEDEEVDAGEHGVGGGARGAVEGVDGQVPAGMEAGDDGFAGGRASEESVLGAEEGGEGEVQVVEEVVGGVDAGGGQGGGMGDESDAGGTADGGGGEGFGCRGGWKAENGENWKDFPIISTGSGEAGGVGDEGGEGGGEEGELGGGGASLAGSKTAAAARISSREASRWMRPLKSGLRRAKERRDRRCRWMRTLGARGQKMMRTGLPSMAWKSTGFSRKPRKTRGVWSSSTPGLRRWGKAMPSPMPVDWSCSRATRACRRKGRLTVSGRFISETTDWKTSPTEVPGMR